MKKLLLISAFSICSFSVDAGIGTWTGKASMSLSRSTHVGFTLQGKGYVCAGAKDPASNDYKDLWQYDASSNTWSQKADLPGIARRELSCFTIDSFAYVGHGRNVGTGEIFYSFYKYNPNTNSWSSIADCPVKRYTSTGFSIDSIGYITCGILPGVARYKDLWAYNPRTNQWTQKASLPTAALNRSYACVVSLNHKAYLMGGYEGQHMDDFYTYDPSNNSWTTLKSYPGGKRNAVSGFAFGDYVVMGNGRDGGNTTYKDWYYYDIPSNTWTQMNDYPETNSAGNSCFMINGKGYICGGNNLSGTQTNIVYELSAAPLNLKSGRAITKLHTFKPMGSKFLMIDAESDQYQVNVYSISGQQLFSEHYQLDQEQRLSVDLQVLAVGQYIAEIVSSSGRQYLKFILE